MMYYLSCMAVCMNMQKAGMIFPFPKKKPKRVLFRGRIGSGSRLCLHIEAIFGMRDFYPVSYVFTKKMN